MNKPTYFTDFAYSNNSNKSGSSSCDSTEVQQVPEVSLACKIMEEILATSGYNSTEMPASASPSNVESAEDADQSPAVGGNVMLVEDDVDDEGDCEIIGVYPSPKGKNSGSRYLIIRRNDTRRGVLYIIHLRSVSFCFRVTGGAYGPLYHQSTPVQLANNSSNDPHLGAVINVEEQGGNDDVVPAAGHVRWSYEFEKNHDPSPSPTKLIEVQPIETKNDAFVRDTRGQGLFHLIRRLKHSINNIFSNAENEDASSVGDSAAATEGIQYNGGGDRKRSRMQVNQVQAMESFVVDSAGVATRCGVDNLQISNSNSSVLVTPQAIMVDAENNRNGLQNQGDKLADEYNRDDSMGIAAPSSSSDCNDVNGQNGEERPSVTDSMGIAAPSFSSDCNDENGQNGDERPSVIILNQISETPWDRMMQKTAAIANNAGAITYSSPSEVATVLDPRPDQRNEERIRKLLLDRKNKIVWLTPDTAAITCLKLRNVETDENGMETESMTMITFCYPKQPQRLLPALKNMIMKKRAEQVIKKAESK
jgi:hypothetical protein